jgi:hypothetical protein
VQPGEKFSDDQAFLLFNDAFIESLEDLAPQQRIDVLAEVVTLCANPGGNHTLSNRPGQKLAGWNTLDVLQEEYRVVFASRIEEVDGQPVGHIEVLVLGPRKADAVYDMAEALRNTGRLSEDELTEVWEALALLDTVAEDVGLDGWDYRPEPAPIGLIRSVVAAGVLDEETASAMTKDEIHAAMEHGWDEETGALDPTGALAAALQRARAGVEALNLTRILGSRKKPRCGAVMKRTLKRCIRRKDHPGPHRATV